jgi:DNA invertase Pin-like site-specific DNA recombinase
MPLRYARLLRLSGKKQVERASRKKGEPDIPTQREEIERFVAVKEEWVFAKEYLEPGVSAYSKSRYERDKLEEALRDAEAGLFDVLVVWKGDRLSRRIQDFPGIVADFEELGVQVWSVVDAPGGKKWSSKTALDLLLLSVEGFKNQSESENTSIRSKTNRRAKAADGKWMGGRTPYGYQLLAEKDEAGEPLIFGGRPSLYLSPHETNAVIVREIFNRYAAGQGINRIAEWLNQSGIPSPGGKLWGPRPVTIVLDNPIYSGALVYGRHMDQSKEGAVKITAQGRHEPIITVSLWERVVDLRLAKSTLSMRQRSDRFGYSLSGVLYCGECGSAMFGRKLYMKKNGKVKRVPIYICNNYQTRGLCQSVYIRSHIAEEKFIAALEGLTNPAGLGLVMEEHMAKQQQAKADAAQLRRSVETEIRLCDSAIAEARRGWLEEKEISAAEFTVIRDEYLIKKSGLQEQLAESPAAPQAGPDMAALTVMAADIRANWPDMEVAERKVYAIQMCVALQRRPLVYKDKRLELLDIGTARATASYYWLPDGQKQRRWNPAE